MAEPLSPDPTTVHKPRPSILSPSSPFFLGSNDDKLERAQARAARAAAIRRKQVASAAADNAPPDPYLGKQQILELFQNCIKLASENKINQKNTWELSLIDHLCDIIKVDDEDDVETNFQKASCTLEAGVKIYSLRVDSVHSEAYKVLGGINRVGQENEQDSIAEDDNNNNNEQEEGHSKKDMAKKLSPLTTLESSFDALNVKKFDAAFAVDPLYHQTSAQFDEGGAKGLLLNNLGVYGGCKVLFDSLEIPGKSMSCEIQHDKAEAIDVSFVRENIEQMALNMPKMNDISPSLRDIINRFDEDNQRPSDTFSSDPNSGEQVYEPSNNHAEFDGDAYDNSGTWDFDHDEQTSVVGEGPYGEDPDLPSHHEESEPFKFHDPDVDDRFAEVDGYLFLSLGLTSKQNAWAGPDHWKYRKAKGAEDPTKENGSPVAIRKQKNKKQAEVDIDFTKALESDMSDVFAPPKNPKSILVPASREPCNTTLPEDCHYQPEDLVKLFLLPNVMCLGRRGRKVADGPSQQRDEDGPLPSWDDEIGFGGQFDDGNAYSDTEDTSTLVSQPRQVNKIEVQYDKTSKQVDVQALKETLWDRMQESQKTSVQVETISFKHVVATFPSNCRAAATVKDISPHLCFICLLHLANEHGLSIHGCASMDDLTVHLPHSNDMVQGVTH